MAGAKVDAFDPTVKNQVQAASVRNSVSSGPEITLGVHPEDTRLFGTNKWLLVVPKRPGQYFHRNMAPYRTIENLHNEIRSFVSRQRDDVLNRQAALMEQQDKYRKFSMPPEDKIAELGKRIKALQDTSVWAFRHVIRVVLNGQFPEDTTSLKAVKALPDKVEVKAFGSEEAVAMENEKCQPVKCRMFDGWGKQTPPYIVEKWVIVK